MKQKTTIQNDQLGIVNPSVDHSECPGCGWMPPDTQNLPAYCPECGMPLNPQKDIPDSCSWTTMDPKEYWRCDDEHF